MKKLLIGLLAVMTLTFVSCHKDKEEESPTAERTVLIYMAGQNNLTYWSGSSFRYAEEDLKEIRNGVANMGDNHLLVYVSLAKDPDPKHDDHLPYLLHFRKGELRDSIPLDSTMIPSDPATFKTIVQKAFTNYPAKDYGLVLWGHGTGWLFRSDSLDSNQSRRRAYGGSNPNRSNQGAGDVWLNIPTMAKILKSQQHMKFIFADCCNMMCAEVAYDLKDVCDYFIGSPGEIPGPGAPYDLIVPSLMEKETFYKSICDKYAEEYYNEVPLAVVKSSEMVSLANATRTILQTMDPPRYYKSTELRDKRLIYYLDYNLYDMNHFLKSFASEAEYNSWKPAFDKAVIYKKFASRWDTMSHVYFQYMDLNETNFGGMSMFIPQQGLQSTDNLEISKTGWYYAAGYDTVGW